MGLVALMMGAAALYLVRVTPPEIRRWQNGTEAVYVGPANYSYVLDDGSTGRFLSDRDCGWGTEVTGTNARGREVTRAIWGFCDSAGYFPDGTEWAMPFGFPTNVIGVADPATGADGPIVSPAFGDQTGTPGALKNWISTGVADNHPFICPDGNSRHEWIRGMGTLPDDEPSVETIIIFYQNYCAEGLTVNYLAGGGGVALAQWSADFPDQPVPAERLNDAWLLPGLFRDHRLRVDLAAYTYGTGPLFVTEGSETFIYIYMCGAAADCTVARAPVDPSQPGRVNAGQLATADAWQYWSVEGWADFGELGDLGTCAPTVADDCDGFPEPVSVVSSDPNDPYSWPAAEPSIKEVDGRYYLLYAPGYPSDVFVYRVADSPLGPFDEFHFVEMPDGHCRLDCRVPIWHPELDTDDGWAFSYLDLDGLTDQIQNDRDMGQIRIARVAPPGAD
jgi:hypothetical protein